jgi:hypothetical protein
MKRLLILLAVSTSVSALEQGDYGYGHTYHGYTSLEQQQEAQHNQYNLQQIEQTNLAIQINNQINGGGEPEHARGLDYSDTSSIYSEE